jgi:hypothetical protein
LGGVFVSEEPKKKIQVESFLPPVKPEKPKEPAKRVDLSEEMGRCRSKTGGNNSDKK